jgi:carnosine N-methyltransferase
MLARPLLCDGSSQGTYDGVVTCFFIDTAVHVFDYLQASHRLLKPGGVWINHGPLQVSHQ